MIIKHGVDIVNIKRIALLYAKYNTKFLHKIFTINEITYATTKNVVNISTLAKRFAAKEAFAKALGRGIGNLAFKDIEVINNNFGAPQIVISKKIYTLLGVKSACKVQCSLSLSDDNNMAIASVVVFIT